jgi:hypothetical protein
MNLRQWWQRKRNAWVARSIRKIAAKRGLSLDGISDEQIGMVIAQVGKLGVSPADMLKMAQSMGNAFPEKKLKAGKK